MFTLVLQKNHTYSIKLSVKNLEKGFIVYIEAAMERFTLHKKVKRIVQALDMCYTLQLVNDFSQSLREKNLKSIALGMEAWECATEDMKYVNG